MYPLEALNNTLCIGRIFGVLMPCQLLYVVWVFIIILWMVLSPLGATNRVNYIDHYCRDVNLFR